MRQARPLSKARGRGINGPIDIESVALRAQGPRLARIGIDWLEASCRRGPHEPLAVDIGLVP